jgi:hypothetical protein
MKKIINICNAIKKYLFRDTKYFFLRSLRQFQDNYRNHCQFYSEQELMELIKKGKSIIRIGDGEIGLLHFLPIHYQKYSNEIRNDFLKIIKNTNENSSYILMIPLFVNYTNKELQSLGYNKVRVWLPLKVSYEMIFNKKVKCFDAHIFYKDSGFKNLIFLYAKTRKIIIVTNQRNTDMIKQSELARDVFGYIVCRTENTYETRIDIQSEITTLINNSGIPKENFVILLSAGLAKTIIYDMSLQGYQLLDIGKGLESYCTGISLEHEI